MLKESGLAAAKGALVGLLETAYRLRTRVGILQFAGTGTHLRVPPQRVPQDIFGLLQAITAGGGTPLRRGVVAALQVLDRERRRYPNEEQLLVLFTDGRSRANLSDIQIPCRLLVIDTETGPVRLGRCRQLATVLGGDYLALDRLPIRAPAAQNQKLT
jgi:magnesium chelatase subunit ChlD-like protein